jgi:hypothetical protein
MRVSKQAPRADCTLAPCAHPCTRLESCLKCHDTTHTHAETTTHAHTDQSGQYVHTVNFQWMTYTVTHDGMTDTLIMHSRLNGHVWPHGWTTVDDDLSLGDGAILYCGTVYALSSVPHLYASAVRA